MKRIGRLALYNAARLGRVMRFVAWIVISTVAQKRAHHVANFSAACQISAARHRGLNDVLYLLCLCYNNFFLFFFGSLSYFTV